MKNIIQTREVKAWRICWVCQHLFGRKYWYFSIIIFFCNYMQKQFSWEGKVFLEKLH